jgi:high-affinity iron transporter
LVPATAQKVTNPLPANEEILKQGRDHWRIMPITSLLLQNDFVGLCERTLPKCQQGIEDMFSASVRNHASDVLNIGILVFREGLECILVLAAVTASMKGEERKYQRPVCIGAAAAFLATVLTWCIAVRIVDDLAKNLPALAVQAATGLLAILVLLVVMNWFFHKVYWTGWISLHNRRKQRLLAHDRNISSGMKVLLGLAFLGFASLYREGFEVVLFLQRYRLELGLPSCFGESL